MPYGDFKDLTRNTVTDKVFRYEAFNIDKNAKSDGYQWGLASVFYRFFVKKKLSSGTVINEIISN